MAEKEKPEAKKEEPKTLVLKELPQVGARTWLGSDGIEYPILTEEEALTEILSTVRELKKVWGK